MVSEAKLTWEERCERDRKRRIAIALELGDPAYVEYCRTMEYGTEAEDAEDARLSAEAAAATPDWRNQRDFNDELDEMYPGDARLFNQLDERLPRLGRTHLFRLPEQHPEEFEYLRRLDRASFPEAAQYFREWRTTSCDSIEVPGTPHCRSAGAGEPPGKPLNKADPLSPSSAGGDVTE